MGVSYKKLFHLLIDRDLKPSVLVKECNISKMTLGKLQKNERVALDVLERVCKFLQCDFADIMEYIPEGHGETPPP